jgi:hypothetical protein
VLLSSGNFAVADSRGCKLFVAETALDCRIHSWPTRHARHAEETCSANPSEVADVEHFVVRWWIQALVAAAGHPASAASAERNILRQPIEQERHPRRVSLTCQPGG